MSKVLIKTMMSELGAIIPQNELDKIADKIAEVIDLKSKATRSNISPLAKSERVKSAILQLGNIKEEIIEKLYDHGVEEPDKIRALTMKTMKKIDKAMRSSFVIKTEEKTEEPVIVQDPTTPKQGEPSTSKEDKDKVDDEGNNIISNIPEYEPPKAQSKILSFIDGKFKIALNERPNEIKNIWDKYKEENDISDEPSVLRHESKTYPLEFKKSIIKANKIFNNIDEYFDIPEDVPTPTFEEIFNAVEQTKEKRKLEKLTNLSEIIEDNRLHCSERQTKNTPKRDLPKELPQPKVQRIGKLMFK